MNTLNTIIGLIPAGGGATRISPLPCSKELFPLGFSSENVNRGPRPKAVTHYLLENMRLANITRSYIILRKGKWDIPAYFGSGSTLGMNIGYLIMDLPYGVPYTLDQAYPFLRGSLVALGFPDILIKPDDAYKHLLLKQAETNADLVLGLFPASNPYKTDMVELTINGQIKSLHIKPDQTQLTYTWQIAVWTPIFSDYMHRYLKNDKNIAGKNELYVGNIIQAAIHDNVKIDSVLFSNGSCLDIGTPDDLIKAVQATNQCPCESHSPHSIWNHRKK